MSIRIAGLTVLSVLAACTTSQAPVEAPVALDPCAEEYLAAFAAGRKLENTEGCNWGELVAQERSDSIQADIARAHPAGGKAIGYKVTNASDGRVVGVITDAMLLASGATVDLSTGSRLLGEGDILVMVGSANINTATTLEEVAASIATVIPFIESSDMMLPQGASRTKAIWTASNGNARWGVMGEPVDVSGMDPAELVTMMGGIEVELFDENGEQMQKSSMRNNPLQSILDVIEDMQRRGNVELKVGDLISLGNFGRPRFPTSGNTYKAVFHGLAEPAPEVVAHYK